MLTTRKCVLGKGEKHEEDLRFGEFWGTKRRLTNWLEYVKGKEEWPQTSLERQNHVGLVKDFLLSKKRGKPLKWQITCIWEDLLPLSVKNKLQGAKRDVTDVMRPVKRLPLYWAGQDGGLDWVRVVEMRKVDGFRNYLGSNFNRIYFELDNVK